MNIITPQARNKNIKIADLALTEPNPLPIPSGCDHREPVLADPVWKTIKADFKNGIVTLKDLQNAQYIWHNGYFGEGSSPRGRLKAGCADRKMNADSDGSSEVSDSYASLPCKEVLRLSFEEALFLSYGLGVLVTVDGHGREMNIDDMWSSFCQINSCFPLLYTVYHHFRSKGWVVKSGLSFGADFMLYPAGPPHVHSQFLVWVDCLWEDTLEADNTLSTRRSTASDISAFVRLSNQTAKNALLCQVLRPRNLTEQDLKRLNCIKKFIVSSVILQRWNPGSDGCGDKILASDM